MSKAKDTAKDQVDAVETPAAAEANQPNTIDTEWGPVQIQSGTVLNSRGKVMSYDDKVKLATKEAKIAFEKKAKEDKKAAEAAQKAEAKAKRDAETAEKKAAKAAEQGPSKEQREALTAAIKAKSEELGFKFNNVRALLKGNKVALEDGEVVVRDAKGENPMSVEAYCKEYGNEEELKKPAPREKSTVERVHPNDRGVVELANRPLSIPIHPEAPWAPFGAPSAVCVNIQNAQVSPNIIDQINAETNEIESVHKGFDLIVDGSNRGLLDRDAVRELGWATQFKVDFIDKLTPDLATQVINHMIAEHRAQFMMFVGDSGIIRNVVPGWREAAAHSEVAQYAYDLLVQSYGSATIEAFDVSNGTMVARFSIPMEKPVTPVEGDILSAGIEVRHRYGTELDAGLYTTRLVCRNGMTSSSTSYGWANRAGGTVQSQLEFLGAQIATAIGTFDKLIEKCQEMAATKWSGKADDIIADRAKQLGIPNKHVAAIIADFNLEPGDSEWNILNAFTRFGTHAAALNQVERNSILSAAGSYVSDFDVVQARLPRRVATRVGADILD